MTRTILFEISNFLNWDLFVIWSLPCTRFGAGLGIWSLRKPVLQFSQILQNEIPILLTRSV
jgi:hypothetical protein